ncbi:MAG: hypothetical protein HOZ81_08440 [Streptomyces sp.]|nr:hypothetical protein [Streptomyces sp.]
MDDLLAACRTQLDNWASAFARARGLSAQALRLHPPLDSNEANGFIHAVDAGLVKIQSDGVFRLAGAAPGKGPYNLFSQGPAPSPSGSTLWLAATARSFVVLTNSE